MQAIRFISIVAVLLLNNGSASAQTEANPDKNPSLPPGESEKIDAYLQTYYSGVIVTMTTKDSLGHTLSCVDIQHQPGLNSAAMKGQQIQLRPSPQLVAALHGAVKEDDTPAVCPKGSVGMFLPTREEIVRMGSLKSFLSKHPDGSPGIPEASLRKEVGANRNSSSP